VPGAAARRRARYQDILEGAHQLSLEVRIGSDRRIGRAVGQIRYTGKLIRDSRCW
jgi:hypothetical protein